jgi:hypothetical protein
VLLTAFAVLVVGALQFAAIVLGIRVVLRGMHEEGAATRASLEAFASGLGRVERRVESAEDAAEGAQIAAGVAATQLRELKNHAAELVNEQRRSYPGRARAGSQPDHDEIEQWPVRARDQTAR